MVALPLLGGPAPDTGAGFFEDRLDPIGGLIAIVAAVGAIVCMATREAGASTFDPSHASPGTAAAAPPKVDIDARMAYIGPYIGGVALVGAQGFEKLGIPGGDWLAGPAFVVCLAAFVFADRLPVVRAEVRRLLVTPFVLVAGGIFEGIVADITPGVDPVGVVGALLSGGSFGGVPGGFLVFVFGMVLAGTAVFYAMLVYAPRELASSYRTPTGRWPLRFAVFLVSLLVGLALAP